MTSRQHLLFDTEKCFFYITNESADEVPAREVVRGPATRVRGMRLSLLRCWVEFTEER